MVGCAVINCRNRSDRCDGHTSNTNVSLFRLPAVTDRYGKEDFELRKKRLAGFLAAISRDDIDPNSLEGHDYRICSRHFLSGKLASLYEVTNLDWLPS